MTIIQKKFHAVLISALIILISTAFAWADNQVLLEQVAVSELVDIEVEIPDSVPPGYHKLLVEVLDDQGVIRSRDALFCKDLDMTVHLDNICPQLAAQGPKETTEVSTGIGAPFSPADDPQGSSSLIVTVFALASTLAASGIAKKEQTSQEKSDDSDPGQGDLQTLAAGMLAYNPKPFGRGDKRLERRGKGDFLANVGPDIARGANRISFMVARIVMDGRYLRSILGWKSWLLPVIAAFITWSGINETQRIAAPLPLLHMTLLLIIGIFDSLAGFYASLAYMLSVAVAGNINSLADFMGVLGTSLVFFAPALLASTFRPLQRNIENSRLFWERLTDYALGLLLTFLAIKSLVGALPSLYRVNLQISSEAQGLAVYGLFALLIRLILEEISWYNYPANLRSQTIVISNTKGRKLLARNTFRFAVFFILSYQFIGPTIYLFLGTLMYLGAQFVSRLPDSKIQSRLIAQLIPSGAVKIVVMSIIGGMWAFLLQGVIEDPQVLVGTMFWIMGLPGLIFSTLEKFAGEKYVSFDDGDAERLGPAYALLSLVIYGLVVASSLGVDLAAQLRSLFS